MWVMLLHEQIIRADQVCRHCVLASPQGKIRPSSVGLRCGQAVGPKRYRCRMGFQLTETPDLES